jgi:hypothetical protein
MRGWWVETNPVGRERALMLAEAEWASERREEQVRAYPDLTDQLHGTV